VGAQLRAGLDIVEMGAAHRRLTGLNLLVNGGLSSLRALRGRPPGFSASSYPSTPPAGGTPGAALGPADLQIDSRLAHRRLSAASRWLGQAVPRERIVEQRRRNYSLLAQRLAGQPGLHPLRPQLPPDCAPYVFPLWVEQPDPGYLELRQLRMPVFRWDRLWPGVPQLPGDQGRAWSHHVLQLACHQDLSDSDLERFIAALLRLYAR
jgi:hypothetical protein